MRTLRLEVRVVSVVLVASLALLGSTSSAVSAAGGRVPSASFDENELALVGDPGEIVCGSVTVRNDGDELLDDIRFEATHLTGMGAMIPSDNVSFNPTAMSLGPGETALLEICVALPAGARADVYVGSVSLLAAGGAVMDDLTLSAAVNCVPALDIDDDAYGMSGNEMELGVVLGQTSSGPFEILNTGNCDLMDIQGPLPTAPPLIVTVIVPETCLWGDTVTGTVEAELVEPGLPVGSYQMDITITAEGGASDYFHLTLDVYTAVEPGSWGRIKSLYR